VEDTLPGCFVQGIFNLLIFDDDKSPGLKVAEGGCPSSRFKDHLEFLFLNWIRFEFPNRPSVFNGMEYIVHAWLLSPLLSSPHRWGREGWGAKFIFFSIVEL
jgi:hypothetical protein